MKFVEESEGAFSAAQLAAAERELEEQKKEWELDRLRALREEEERRMRMADDDEKPLTFGREDAQNQVNSASNSKKLVSKKLPARRGRKPRRNNSKSAQESESESETTTDSESESQEDVVEDSLDEESSHTESQSQGDEDEEEEEEEDEEEEEEDEDDEEEAPNDQNDSERGGYRKRRNRSNKSFSQNHFDLNSPRTRSRGNVKINLWTLDVSPILPGVKPKCRGRPSKMRKQEDLEMRVKAEESFVLPLAPASSQKKLTNRNTSSKLENEHSATNQKSIVASASKPIDMKSSKIFFGKDVTVSLENCKAVIANHCNTTMCPPKAKLRKSTDAKEEHISVAPLDSLQGETCLRLDDSIHSASEQYKASESSVIDGKVDDKASRDRIDSTAPSVCIKKSMHKTALQCNNVGNDASCSEDSENPDVSSISDNSSPCSSATESGTLKMISDSNCTKSSMTLDINEEINVSENSLTAVKNKTVEDVEEASVDSTMEQLTSSDSENATDSTSCSVNEKDKQSKEESSISVEEEDEVCSEDSEENITRPQSPVQSSEEENEERTLTTEEQSKEDVSTSKGKDDGVSISVIERSSSQELGDNVEKCTESDKHEDAQAESTSPTQSNDNKSSQSSLDIPDADDSVGSDGSVESKLKFRKPDAMASGVTTRSAKMSLLVAESFEQKDSETQPCEPKQNERVEVSNSNVSRKEGSSRAVLIRRPDTPRPTTEHGRITRSSAGRSLTPPPSNSESCTKSIQRRRPDTPFPEFLKTSPRPVTRSTSSVNSPSRNEEQTSLPYERPTTRSSKSLDNGFVNPAPFRRSSSIPPMKTTASDTKDHASSTTTRSRKSSDSTTTNIIISRRRPDTPVPTFEQMSRVTRSGLNFTSSLGKSSSSHVPVLRGSKHVRKADSSSDSKWQESPEVSPTRADSLNTDSNGNSVASENCAKQDDPTHCTDTNEKPQRTAKVVAILTLDTRSNHCGKASSSLHGKASHCNSTETKNAKKGSDTNSTSSDSPGNNCVVRITDITSNCKLDGWCDSGDRVSSTVLSNVASTYTNSGKTGKATSVNKTASPMNSKLKTDKLPLPVQSAVIALVDLDNDPNYDSSDGSKRLRRKIKRTRLSSSSFGKPLMGNNKASESQISDALDDEEEEQIPPLKKPVRSQLPPPPASPSSQTTTQLEKISSGTVS